MLRLSLASLFLALWGCVDEPLVVVKNETTSNLFDVRFSDCYWPGPLSPGAVTSPACIPAQMRGRVTFSLLDEFTTTPPPVGPDPGLSRYETIEEITLNESEYHTLPLNFQDTQIVQ